MERTFEMTDKAKRKVPDLIAYGVSDGDNPIWTRIGTAWEHDDRKGINLQLDLVPVRFSGRIVLRAPRAK
jgi:hypothetical protein